MIFFSKYLRMSIIYCTLALENTMLCDTYLCDTMLYCG